MIVSKHMEALLQVEVVSSTLDVKALRRLFDTISSHVRSLSAMNVQEDSYSNLLCPVLINKIPPELQLIVSRKVSEENWNLGKLMAAIEEEVIARERLGQSQLKASVHKGHSKPSPSAVTLVTKGLPTSDPRCCSCDQTHSPTKCTEVTEVEKRRQLLRKVGRCYSCLRKGHIYRDCRTSNRCRSCQGKHHTSICTTKGESTFQDTPASTTLAEPTTSNLNPSALEFNCTSSLYIGTTKTVLLQTASAVVSNPHNQGASLKLRMVLDNGSQHSYLTQHARLADIGEAKIGHCSVWDQASGASDV